MKKMVCFVLMTALAVSLSGCPLTAGKIAGMWQWVEAARIVNPTIIDDYDSDAVAQNFVNNGRVRKTITFGDEKRFTYIEETFLADREARVRGDKGVGVVWKWIETYRTTGEYTTKRFAEAGHLLAIPGLDSELHVDITEHTDTFTINKRDTNGIPVLDSQLRTLTEYITVTSAATAENPLVLRGLLGMNPFDELMIFWAEGGGVDKNLEYNQSIQDKVETYVRVDTEE
ncbi:MAG: hypothetical protein KAH38_09565 [Candidatus Hydrogenedentes bacterium]|nr:hypothetical protein [Candidatus Hydrogenedentota bacterium]